MAVSDDKPIAASFSFTSDQQPSTPRLPPVIAALFEQQSFLDLAESDPSGSVPRLSLLPESSISQQLLQPDMAPPRQILLPKDRFGLAFGSLKTQTYHDPIARAPGSHAYVLSPGH
jgi:hypothetical protein